MPEMKYNLTPPFLVTESVLVVDDRSKEKLQHPTKHHHSTHVTGEDLRMPLRLHIMFSYFPSKKPLVSALNDYDNKILFLITDNVN